MIIKHLKPKKVLFDLATNRQVSTPSKTSLWFDSTSEYNTYLMLSKYFTPDIWNISIHAALCIGDLRWKIDFCISPKANTIKMFDKITTLAMVVNNCRFNYPITQLWVEYKGVQDTNFIKKMGILKTSYTELSNRVILCSDNDSAFGIFDDFDNRFYTHSIIGCYNLEKLIKQIIP